MSIVNPVTIKKYKNKTNYCMKQIVITEQNKTKLKISPLLQKLDYTPKENGKEKVPLRLC